LRRFGDGSGELIAYRRPDTEDAATSTYRLVPCDDPEALCAALEAALGVVGEVRKRRTLWLVGRTRVHLDRVEGLGDFVELEVVLEAGEPEETGMREAERLADALGIEAGARLAAAYVDLLTEGGSIYSPVNDPT
jgi:predicted adenylyl cyclase CyaB